MSSPKDYDLVPEAYNTRADEMWRHIEKHVDFSDKSVLDVGCGRADLMVRSWMSGARAVYGIDSSPITINEARIRTLDLVKAGARIYFLQKDIEQWSTRWPGKHDIVICTSVLPYTKEPDVLMRNMRRDAKQAIIECQYAGDGPGFDHIKNDSDMLSWLMMFGWHEIDKIGFSTVVSRDRTRSIWLCKDVIPF